MFYLWYINGYVKYFNFDSKHNFKKSIDEFAELEQKPKDSILFE